jgi:hypothetical protein
MGASSSLTHYTLDGKQEDDGEEKVLLHQPDLKDYCLGLGLFPIVHGEARDVFSPLVALPQAMLLGHWSWSGAPFRARKLFFLCR